jgi:hypothetical protein
VPEHSRVTLHVTGTVADVIEGRPPTAGRWIELAPYAAGFEAGSPQSVETIGEFISFNGVGYAASPGRGPELHRLLVGPRVISNGAVFIPRDARPAAIVEVEQPTPMTDVYRSLLSRIRNPLCFVGTGTFSAYHGIALSKAPIHGEHIFDHQNEYYEQPPMKSGQVPAGLVGCVADFGALSAARREDLGRVLYKNPLDPPGDLTSHTHSLVLHAPAADVREIRPEGAVAVRHLVADSVLGRGRLEVYEIGSLAEITSTR